MPSVTLSNAEDKAAIKKQLPSSSNKILTATVVRLYQAHPDPNQWTYTNIFGAIALVQDKSKGYSFFFRIVDLQNHKGILWEQELGPRFVYRNDSSFFHTFGTDGYVAGLSFADENEAATFYKKVIDREKSAKKVKAKPVKMEKSMSFFSSSKSKTKGKIDKSLIGKPMDFKHLGHIGYDANSGFSAHHEDPEWQKLFKQLGVDGAAQQEAFRDSETMKTLVNFVQKNGGITQVNQSLQNGSLNGIGGSNSKPPPPAGAVAKTKRPPPPPPPSSNKPGKVGVPGGLPPPPPPPNRSANLSPPPSLPTRAPNIPPPPDRSTNLSPTPARGPGLPNRTKVPAPSLPQRQLSPTPPPSKPPPLPSSQRPALPGSKPPLPSNKPPPLPTTQRPALPGKKPPPLPTASRPASSSTNSSKLSSGPPPPPPNMPSIPPAVVAPPSTPPVTSVGGPPPPPPPPPPTFSGGPPPPPPPPPPTFSGGPPPPPPPPPMGTPGAPPPPPPGMPSTPLPSSGGDGRSDLLKSIQQGAKLRKVGPPEARDSAVSPPPPPAAGGDNLANALLSILENRRNDLESDAEDDDDWDSD